MSQSNTSHLIEMANQITLNLSHGREQIECINEIAKHIQRFWALSMRVQLIALVAQDVPQIHKRVKIAVTQLSDYSAPT
jgi:formate dehydrogenase subunit delta